MPRKGAQCHWRKASAGAPCCPLLCWARSPVPALGCFWEHCHPSVPWTRYRARPGLRQSTQRTLARRRHQSLQARARGSLPQAAAALASPPPSTSGQSCRCLAPLPASCTVPAGCLSPGVVPVHPQPRHCAHRSWTTRTHSETHPHGALAHVPSGLSSCHSACPPAGQTGTLAHSTAVLCPPPHTSLPEPSVIRQWTQRALVWGNRPACLAPGHPSPLGMRFPRPSTSGRRIRHHKNLLEGGSLGSDPMCASFCQLRTPPPSQALSQCPGGARWGGRAGHSVPGRWLCLARGFLPIVQVGLSDEGRNSRLARCA